MSGAAAAIPKAARIAKVTAAGEEVWSMRAKNTSFQSEAATSSSAAAAAKAILPVVPKDGSFLIVFTAPV